MTAITHYLQSMGGFMLLALPLWLFFRTLWLMHKQQSPRWGRELLLAVLVLYLIGLASQTLTFHRSYFSDLQELWARAMQRWENRFGINLTPGYTIRSMLDRGSHGQKVINLAGNVLIFAPWAFCRPFCGGVGGTGGQRWG